MDADETGGAACSQDLAAGSKGPAEGTVLDDDEVGSGDADVEKEPRPCPEDSWLQGRKSLGSWRISDMLTEMNNRLQAEGNSVVLPQFSRRTDAIHYLSHVMEDGIFAVNQSSPPEADDMEFVVRRVRSLGLSGQAEKTLIYQEGGQGSADPEGKPPLAPTVSEGTVVWQLPDHVPFVNRPFESEIHCAVNFTQFCCVLLVTWCYRVLLSCYLRPK